MAELGSASGNEDVFRHFQKMIHYRRRKNVLKRNTKAPQNGLPGVSFHGIHPWEADQERSPESWALCSQEEPGGNRG